jgi:cephalosporin hydroxylase
VIKPKVRFWNGYYWCRYMGITGQGCSIEESVKDMWNLYREMIKECRPSFIIKSYRR